MSDTQTVESPSRQSTFIDVLRNRGFLRLWLVQAFSQTGQNMVNFALLIQVRAIIEGNQIQQANTAIGLTVLAFSIPAVIFSPIAGVVVERANKRTVLVVTNALRGLAVFGFLTIQPDWRPLLALTSLYVIAFASGAVGQFFGPALGASIPSLVPTKGIVNANALFNLTFTVSQLAGFAALGPFLVRLIGLDDVFVLIIIVFSACALISITIPSTPSVARAKAPGQSPTGTMFRDIREGAVFIIQSPLLMKAIGYLSLATASYLMIAVLGPEFISGVLKLPAQDIVFIVGPAGAGVVVGTLLVGRIVSRIGPERTSDVGLAAAGGALMLLALLEPFGSLFWIEGGVVGHGTIVMAAILAAFLGVFNGLVLAPSQSLLQSSSPEHIRARVYAAFFTVSNGVAFIPIIFAGALADLFGVVKVLVALGVILLLIGVFQLEGGVHEGGEDLNTPGPHRLGEQ